MDSLGTWLMWIWICLGWGLAISVFYTLAAFAIAHPFIATAILRGILIVLVSPLLIMFLIAHVYYFFPSSHTTIDGWYDSAMSTVDRSLYKWKYGDDLATADHFMDLPLYRSNYDLTIVDEVCRNLLPTYIDPYDVEERRRFCKFDITPLAFSTYLAKDENGQFLYTVDEARALYLERVNNK